MPRPILRQGNRGADVERLTRILKRRGYLEETRGSVDLTVRRAVEEFQARHVDERDEPLVADGVVGPLTWWALEKNEPASRPGDVRWDQRMPPEGGSERARAALRTAIAEAKAGAREIGANNSGRFVTKYLNGLTPAPANWCAGFVSWCYSQHSAGIPYSYSLGARDIRQQFKRRAWLLEDELPEPADIIVWWRGRREGWKGHIGLVHRCSNGLVYTIEGNKGNFPAPVRGFTYTLGRIDKLLGFGRVRD